MSQSTPGEMWARGRCHHPMGWGGALGLCRRRDVAVVHWERMLWTKAKYTGTGLTQAIRETHRSLLQVVSDQPLAETTDSCLFHICWFSD